MLPGAGKRKLMADPDGPLETVVGATPTTVLV
jgi:hypothetical protein